MKDKAKYPIVSGVFLILALGFNLIGFFEMPEYIKSGMPFLNQTELMPSLSFVLGATFLVGLSFVMTLIYKNAKWMAITLLLTGINIFVVLINL